jgi:hypothetical protein
LKKAAAKVLSATWQRCRVHFMRNALAHVGTKQRAMVAAAIRTAFTQESREAAHKEWCAVADRLRERFPKLGALMDEAENDVLAHLAFPKEHWPQLHSTDALDKRFFRFSIVASISLFGSTGPFPRPGPRSDAADARRACQDRAPAPEGFGLDGAEHVGRLASIGFWM